MSQQQQTYAGILQAGKTLSETSDLIMQSWEYRNQAGDMLSEKRPDPMVRKERLHDPNSGRAYEFDPGAAIKTTPIASRTG